MAGDRGGWAVGVVAGLRATSRARSSSPSDSRLWRIFALLRRGVREAAIQGVTGIAPWFLAEFGRGVALERAISEYGTRLLDVADGGAMSVLATAKRAGLSDRDIGALAWIPAADLRATRLAVGLVPGFAMVDTCAAEFAAETPYFYSTFAAAGSAPEAPAGRAPRRDGDRLGAGPDRAGDRVRLLRRPGRRHAADRGLAGGDDQLEPGDRLDRLRCVVTPVLRAARLRVRARRHRLRVAGLRRRRAAPAGDGRSSAARRRSTSPHRWPPAACRCWAPTSRRSTRPRSGRGSRRCSTGSASRSPKAAWRTRSRRR